MRALLLVALLAAPQDVEYRRVLDFVYEGRGDAALQRFDQLALQDPRDPLLGYLQALAFVWKVEQQPSEGPLDKELLRRVDRAVALADARLRAAPDDRRALLARGASHGVRSRYHFFRLQRTGAARSGARMREDLLRLREVDPASQDALFGLGLYDYYADVLSPFARLLRFMTRMPAGNRQRGLALIEQARSGFWHDTEVRVQLYEIGAFWDDRPDGALAEMRALRQRYPAWPLWGLKLAEHLRERMGLYGESAQVAREMLALGERGHPNYVGAALLQARLALGEALTLDLRLPDARTELLPLTGRGDAAGARAHLLLARALELEGDRVGAEAHYRRAEGAPERDVRKRAQRALDSPLPAALVQSTRLLAQARRAREGRDRARAALLYREALSAWPASQEAGVRVAEDALARGDARAARDALQRIDSIEHPQPPWVRACALLVRGQLRDLEGRRPEAVLLYKRVLERPYGQREFEQQAAEGLRRPFRVGGGPAAWMYGSILYSMNRPPVARP